MLFKLHYFLLTSGWAASTTLLGVFMSTYTNASSMEIGALFMTMPFLGIISRPIICSKADRESTHKKYLMYSQFILGISYIPYIVIPHLGPAVYEAYPNACYYTLAITKIMGDVALNGAISIGDALAINYTHRIGAEFMVYRVWGTIAWMLFGVIIGHVNEVSFFAKFTPAFMILVASSILDGIIIWLWPDEYFKMVPMDEIKKAHDLRASQGLPRSMDSLLPMSQVLAHMRHKLVSILICASTETKDTDKQIESNYQKDTNQIQIHNENVDQTKKKTDEPIVIDKSTQIKILGLLFRRDPRIWLYLSFLVLLGMTLSVVGFFFIGLADICNPEVDCDFSQLAGYLQVSQAASETFIFFYIKPIKARIGRVSFCAIAILIAGLENLVYLNYWYTMDPRYTLLTNLGRGIYYGISILLMTDVAYVFANEVGYLLPELELRGVITDTSVHYSEQLKLSLLATMQAITGAAIDGFGRGFGSLLVGLLIDSYSFGGLWLPLNVLCWSGFVACVLVYLFDKIFQPNLGLDVKAALAQKQQATEL